MNANLLKNVKILVVDDEPLILEILIEEFELLEAKVTSASSGNKAFEILTKEPFDIILTDMTMPDGDGLSLLKKINEKLDIKPLIFISSGFYKITDSEIKSLNVIAVLNKPFSIQEFLKVLPFS